APPQLKNDQQTRFEWSQDAVLVHLGSHSLNAQCQIRTQQLPRGIIQTDMMISSPETRYGGVLSFVTSWRAEDASA
ncbi:hypothetical protein M441DRAFT_135816, partial [Trichoderma asperellum CBS 433.97]